MNETTAAMAGDALVQKHGLHLAPKGDGGLVPLAPQPADFYAFLPQHLYLYRPTRELWPAASVNGRLPMIELPDGKKVAPAAWLDRHRAVEQMVWDPGMEEIISDHVMQVSGWVRHPSARVYNLYRAPLARAGDPAKAGRWRDHLRLLYPDEADHIECWLAHRVQYPGDKINHALVLGGAQGIGKDTLLEPVKAAVGPWNFQDISPKQMLGRFNGWQKGVIVRISEARDLGDVDRFAFYEGSKVITAAPPDVLRVDEKNLREHYVVNVCGVVITTNHKADGLFLPADDRRHFVAWSGLERSEFDAGYWRSLYGWYSRSGFGHVCQFLATLDLTEFDPKAPPPKTAAFWAIVQAGDAPEGGQLRDILDRLGNPPALVVLDLIEGARDLGMLDLSEELRDPKGRRATPHRLDRVGYVTVRNPDAPKDGYFVVGGRRQAIYARARLPFSEQIQAARNRSNR